MVKTFYDKRVEERGIEKGREEGRKEIANENRVFIKNLLLKGVSKEVIIDSGKFTSEEIDEIITEIRN